ncbi:MAG TPA: hypothetical protein VK432_03105 [Stellaceae bacterium]|nr:hypothetical protein [Stellaceae bacterium]
MAPRNTATPNFRRALPPGFAAQEGDRQPLVDHLRRAITELQQLTDYDTLLDGFAQRVRAARGRTRQEFTINTTRKRPG